MWMSVYLPNKHSIKCLLEYSHHFLSGFLLLSVQQHAVVLRPQVQPGRDKVHGEDTNRHWWHEGAWDHQWGLPTHIPGFWEGENIRAPSKVCVHKSVTIFIYLLFKWKDFFIFLFSVQSRTKQTGLRYTHFSYLTKCLRQVKYSP